MSLSIAFLFVFNVFTLCGMISARRVARRLLKKECSYSNDEAMLSYIEACASVSPLAERLLHEARHPKALNESLDKTVVPEWKHNTDVMTPYAVTWEMTLQDLLLEKTQDGKLEALKCWSNSCLFTCVERNEIIKLFKGKHRLQARRLLFKKKIDKKRKTETETKQDTEQQVRAAKQLLKKHGVLPH